MNLRFVDMYFERVERIDICPRYVDKSNLYRHIVNRTAGDFKLQVLSSIGSILEWTDNRIGSMTYVCRVHNVQSACTRFVFVR